MANSGDELGVGLSLGRAAAAAMKVGGALLAAAGSVWAIARFWELSRVAEPGPRPTTADYAATAGLLLLAWAVGLVLWGGAEVLRRLEDLLATQRENGSGARAANFIPLPRPQSADAASNDSQAALLGQVAECVRDLRDIALLSEHEKTMRVRAESSALARQLESEIPVLLREHNWQEARQQVEQARRRFPSLSAWDALAEQVEQARAQFEAHDIQIAEREISDLAALAAWDRALAVVRHLQRRHPNSPQVGELLRRVQGGIDKTQAEERARLMSKAQEATRQRDWTEALKWVEEVVTRFPNSPEAHDLRLQLPTLKANAEIQVRHRMEEEIKEHVKVGRFPEALRLARQVIAEYPNSPQAAVLREQLPRLQQRAAAR